MVAPVVFFLWPLFASVSGTCIRPVSCVCGKSNQSTVLCAERIPLEIDPCLFLTDCETCRDELNECLTCPIGFQGPTCSEKYGRRATRRKRQENIGNCPTLYPPENGRITYCHNAARNGYCRGRCNSGFTFQGMEDEPEIVLGCRTRGFWHPLRAFPPCVGGEVRARCRDPGSPPPGVTRYPPQIPHPGLFDHYSQINFGCEDPDYVLEGQELLTCQTNGRWSDSMPECVDPPNVDCPYPGKDPNGEVSVRGRQGPSRPTEGEVFTLGVRLLYTCNEGYTRQGPSTLTCQRNGEWKPDNYAPFCISDDSPEPSAYCPNLGPIHNGNVQPSLSSRAPNPDRELPVFTEVEYTCRKGFILQGRKTLTCQENGRWNGVLPSCVEGCGLRTAKVENQVTHGINTTRGEWPWMVAISELSRNNVSNIFCGGALLDRRTVLTAAHCFNMSVNPGPFLLHFGKFFRSTQYDDPQVQYRWSQRVKIHPNYDKDNYDNDIALIRFSPKIRFNERIMPVCLPTPESTRNNLVPQKQGYVTGWGQNELGRQPDILMRAKLPLQSNEVCAASFPGLFYNPSTTVCAGYPDGRTSTCRGDSGSGLVFRDEHSEGRFVVEGIVSYSLVGSCGMPGRYTAFTKVSHFMSWIRRNLETRGWEAS